MIKQLLLVGVGVTLGLPVGHFFVTPLIRRKRAKSRSEHTKPNPSEGQATREMPNTDSSTAI